MSSRTLVVFFTVCFGVSSAGSAQVARVFLSGTGNDANDCTNQATPCRSLQGAVNACPVNGEIIVLESGGFGTANITKSLTINAPAGVVAFNARTITVNIASTDKVVIRGLTMDGKVFGDNDGIAFTGGGTLVVEDSIIAGWASHAISQTAAGSSLIVHNSEIRDSYAGIYVNAGTAHTAIENCRFEYNNTGVWAFNSANVSIRNSVVTNNYVGLEMDEYAQTDTGSIIADTCTVTNNGWGFRAYSFSSAPTTIRVSNSTIYDNNVALYVNTSPAVVQSYGNNRVFGNASGSTFSGTVVPQS